MMGLQKAGTHDWRRLGDLTAEAFYDDPVLQWLYGNDRAIRSNFRILAKEIYLKFGACYFNGNRGAAMWLPPEAKPVPGRLMQLKFALGPGLMGQRGSLKRAMTLGEIMQRHHPDKPHAYLFSIGTSPAARGKGHGKALLRPIIEACDEAAVPIYLENSNPKNHGFYSSWGFKPIGEFAAGEGGPPLVPMWRDPHHKQADFGF